MLTNFHRQEHAALLDNLWGLGSACVVETGAGINGATPAFCQEIFGTDEFSGDREIDFFISQVHAYSKATVDDEPPSLSVAVNSGSGGVPTPNQVDAHDDTQKLEVPIPTWLTVFIRAVPWHATNNSERRYNPYHLRIIGRELSPSQEGNHDVDVGEVLKNSVVETGGSDDDFEFQYDRMACAGGENVAYFGDGEFDGARNEKERVSAFEKERDGLGARGNDSVEEKMAQLEAVTFCAKGVTHVNCHGETSFLSLKDWCLEKQRFDAMSRMRICKR